MNLVDYQKIAVDLHINFLTSMYQRFGLQECPSYYPISFKPLLSLGGIGFNREGKLELLLNDILINNTFDRQQFEQTIAHESGHIAHITVNGFDTNKPQKALNVACSEPVGSIIADLATLIFFSLNENANRYFDKLSDYGGEPALKLYKCLENPTEILTKLSRQNGRELYRTITKLLGRDHLYEDPVLEEWVLELIEN